MATKSKLDPRKMMEKAIEVMRASVGEVRTDGKPNPLVGAVLVRPDGSIATAARGELREGNHAEYTLLERKCVGEKLDGCILFATLEPCLNRNHPKRGCARHIVSARIKEVYVGIEDDNPLRGSAVMVLYPDINPDKLSGLQINTRRKSIPPTQIPTKCRDRQPNSWEGRDLRHQVTLRTQAAEAYQLPAPDTSLSSFCCSPKDHRSIFLSH